MSLCCVEAQTDLAMDGLQDLIKRLLGEGLDTMTLATALATHLVLHCERHELRMDRVIEVAQRSMAQAMILEALRQSTEH